MNLCVRNFFKPNIIGGLFRYSSAPEPEQFEAVIVDDEEIARKEAEIDKKRNKSKLSSAHFNLINGRRPYETPTCLAHKTVKYNRKLYGKYGTASGVNPSLCWPTLKDIEETKEYESVAYPFTIQEMIEQAAKSRLEERKQIEKRENEIAAKLEKLEQWKKELNDKINKKLSDAKAAKEKKERLVDEVRRHFGFKLDPRDERFQEMLAKREKEQKKLEKLARKEAKEKTMLAKFQQQNAEMSDKAKKNIS